MCIYEQCVCVCVLLCVCEREQCVCVHTTGNANKQVSSACTDYTQDVQSSPNIGTARSSPLFLLYTEDNLVSGQKMQMR